MSHRPILWAVALVAATAGPLQAQHEHGPPRAADSTSAAAMGHGPGMGMMPGMPGLMQPSPRGLLGAAEHLDLSADQRERLRALAERAEGEHQGHMRAAMDAHARAVAALREDATDPDAAAAAIEELAAHMGRAHAAMARGAIEARALLTPDQRERVTQAMEMMRGMHEMHGPGASPMPGQAH